MGFWGDGSGLPALRPAMPGSDDAMLQRRIYWVLGDGVCGAVVAAFRPRRCR